MYGYLGNLIGIAAGISILALGLAVQQYLTLKEAERRAKCRERRREIEAAAIANRFRIVDICNEFTEECKAKKQNIVFKGIFGEQMNKAEAERSRDENGI